jgi:hypothetical protein
MENQNSKEYLKQSLEIIMSQLREKVYSHSANISNYNEVNLYNTVNPMYSAETFKSYQDQLEDSKDN